MKDKTKELVEYEDVESINPVTGAIQITKIEKPVGRTPEQIAENTKAQLKQYGLELVEKVDFTDPLTGKRELITINRAGHNEAQLIRDLANPNLTRDRKDFAMSMYLYERGQHNTSMIVDLFRYKGQHTTDTQVFKTQIRFDFELFVNSFCTYLKDQEAIVSTILDMDVREERSNFFSHIQEMKQKEQEAARKEERDAERINITYYQYRLSKAKEGESVNRAECALVALAMHALDEADILQENVRKLAEAREREHGKGIYVSADGRPYTLDDKGLEEVIAADRESTARTKKDVQS